MPNGFWYASGPHTTDEVIAGSAFSKGDLLGLDSNSSLSRLNPYALAAGTLFGIATADSTQSIRNLCGVLIPGPDTLLWSRTTSGVTLVAGENSGVSFIDGDAPGRYWVDESTTTNAVVVVKGTNVIDQSVESKVLVKLKYAGGELDLS